VKYPEDKDPVPTKVDAIKRLVMPSSNFSKRVVTLIGGTGLAQAMPILASPILSRLYTAKDFGLFALFLAISSVLATLASGRYELAIVLPARDSDGAKLTIAAIYLSVVVALALLVTVLLGNLFFRGFLPKAPIESWLYLIPFAVCVTAVYQSITYWLIRKCEFQRLAATRVTRSLMTVVAMLGFGVQHRIAGGLILGTLIGQGLVSVGLFAQMRGQLYGAAGSASRASLSQALRRYNAFPKYSIPASTINAIIGDLPVFFLSGAFGASAAGYFGLSQRVLGGPLSTISGAFADVFKQQANQDYLQNGTCRPIWRITFARLMLISLVPLITLLAAGPALFAFVFGEQWRMAGKFAQLMAPYVMLGFVASPLSRTIYVAEKMRYDLIWQGTLLVLALGSLFLGRAFGTALTSVGLFSATYSAMYIVYLIMSYNFARKPPSAHAEDSTSVAFGINPSHAETRP
jgi:O-antigen/teichoic acid export membrane protein